MIEQPKHTAAYGLYRDLDKRNYQAVADKLSVSMTSVKKWGKEFHWQERVMLHDKEIADGVQKKMMPEWIEMKAYLLKTLLEQVKKARDDNIAPQNTRDIVAAIKEIRSMMGEDEVTQLKGEVTHEITIANTMSEYDGLLTRIIAQDQDPDNNPDNPE